MAAYMSATSSSSDTSEFNDDNSADLSYGTITTIPDSLLIRRKAIRAINLQHNSISELPSVISSFSNLITLNLSNNELSSLPQEISNLKNLRTFLVKNNSLKASAIPKDFGRLNSLEILNVSGNELGEVPQQFTELNRLQELYLGGNVITDVPSSIKSLHRLEVLYLGGNKITDIPAEIGQLHKLSALVLCDNQIQSLPPTMIHLRQLKSLSLHNNNLATLPTEIVSLNLSELSLRNNPLVNKFVQDMTYEPPSLLELAGRIVKIERIKYTKADLPHNLVKYLDSAQRCVNPKCRGVYFSCRIEHVKFVDFCGKYRLPLLQYLCSPKCRTVPAVYHNSDTETDEEESANAKLRRVLLG